MEIYLDSAATTKPCEAAISACFYAMAENYGNPSSLHGLGIKAENAVTEARKAVAAGLVCDPGCITFTSGATESNNTVILGAAERYAKRKKKVVISAVEHPSVAQPVKYLEDHGFTVVRVKPGRNGCIDADDFINAVDENTFLASCMFVNNETGAVMPVRKIFSAVKKRCPECITHCDAVQGFMKLPIRAADSPVDFMTVSAHKIHGVKGVGALYSKKGVRIPPHVYGGGQEKGMRSGTESVPLIAAFGAAVRTVMPTMQSAYENAEALSGYLIKQLEGLGYVDINSTAENRCPYIINFSVRGIRSEIMLHFLESREIYVSSGSACSKGAHSSVLEAMGLSADTADSAIRVSLCRTTSKGELDLLLRGISDGYSQLAKR
ncbi:MAG: cysteine desulfurase [Oscillospiraceae bacterium]|nr:cysteine desulfurase [Oscillospiraceae bacterium]